MKNFLLICLLISISNSFADVPGNKARPDYDVIVSGLSSYNDYTFYAQDFDSTSILHDSSSIHIIGGHGAPQCVNIWAIQHKTKISTDTISFCSGDEELAIKVRLNIMDDHLSFARMVTPVKKKINKDEPVDIVGDISSGKNQQIMYCISGLSLFVMLTLVFFVWKKNRTSKNKKPL